jgi:hypothetical protein
MLAAALVGVSCDHYFGCREALLSAMISAA